MYSLLKIIRFIEQRRIQNEKELAEAYTESSINAFKTILRIKTDWEKLRDEMSQTTKISKIYLMYKSLIFTVTHTSYSIFNIHTTNLL